MERAILTPNGDIKKTSEFFDSIYLMGWLADEHLVPVEKMPLLSEDSLHLIQIWLLVGLIKESTQHNINFGYTSLTKLYEPT